MESIYEGGNVADAAINDFRNNRHIGKSIATEKPFVQKNVAIVKSLDEKNFYPLMSVAKIPEQ